MGEGEREHVNIQRSFAIHVSLQRLAFITGACFFGGQQAWAQEQPLASSEQSRSSSQAENHGLDEIVVTANRREENLQNVPIAVTAVSSQRLEAMGITSTDDLDQVVSGLDIYTNISGTRIVLRGIGATASGAGTENSVATYIDGVYLLSPNAALVQLSNIAQVDVLKGPQGTLFGRNATGGVISIRTHDPHAQPGGDFSIRYGNYDTVTAKGYLTGAITKNVAADIAGFFSRQGKGYGTNLFTGNDINKTDEYSVRSKWLLTPSERDKIRLIGDYSRVSGPSFTSMLVPGTTQNYGPGDTLAIERSDLLPYISFSPSDGKPLQPFTEVGNPFTYNGRFYDAVLTSDPKFRNQSWGVSAQWDHEFDSLRLMSLTAYREGNFHNTFDFIHGAPRQHGEFTYHDRQFTQELQLGSATGARVAWVAGIYYISGRSRDFPFTLTGTLVEPFERIIFDADARTRSIAGFAQGTIPLWSGGRLTAGARYTVERKEMMGDITLQFPAVFGIPDLTSSLTDARKTFRKPTWRIALDQELGSNILGYVSYNRGFKSGLFNALPPGGPDVKAIDPEIVDAFEAGLKTELLDRRLRLNLAAFLMAYKDIQVITSPNNLAAVLQNAAGARIYGLDVDLTGRIGRYLTLSGAATLMHAEFTSYENADFILPLPASAGGGGLRTIGSATGNRIPHAPDFSFNFGADYSRPIGAGEIMINLSYSYTDKWFNDASNLLPQKSYGLISGSATYTFARNHFEIGIWAKNLTNERYYLSKSLTGNPGGSNFGQPGEPRTFGGMVGFTF